MRQCALSAPGGGATGGDNNYSEVAVAIATIFCIDRGYGCCVTKCIMGRVDGYISDTFQWRLEAGS